MTTPRLVGGAIAATVVLAALSVVAIGAATGAFRSGSSAPNGTCTVPALPGTVVDITVTNMGGRMMGGSATMGGMMRVKAAPGQIPAGTVSFRVANTGNLTHELVVLPLPDGQSAGSRELGSNGKVNETSSIGEASSTCGEGAGDGIDPGSASWVTLQLTPGIYELICNLPSHYAAGMYTTLRVT